MIRADTRPNLRTELARRMGAEVADKLDPFFRPYLCLTPGAAAGRSRVGGRPDVPIDFVWPTAIETRRRWFGLAAPRRTVRPLAFIAQLDLSAIDAAGLFEAPLPTAGLLSVFYGGYVGRQEVGRAYHFERHDLSAAWPAGVETALYGPRDAGNIAHAADGPFTPTPLGVGPGGWVAPPYDIDPAPLSKPEAERYADEVIERTDPIWPHRLGGWSDAAQGSPELREPTDPGLDDRGSELRLVWELGAIPSAKLRFDYGRADGGRLQLLIAARDLREQRWERAVITSAF